MEMVSCPVVVEHRKRRFLGKKVVLTIFLGEYISKKVAERAKAKKDGNFDLADKIRKDLLDQGIVIEDQQDKTVWKLK